jgi:hypothetical protein
VVAELWETFDIPDLGIDIYPARPDIDPAWWRRYVAGFRLANRRWPGTSEVIAAWEQRA